MMKRIFFGTIALVAAIFFIGAIGDQFITMITDGSGNVLSTPLTFSNQVTMTVAATVDNNLTRYADVTNLVTGVTNTLGGSITNRVLKSGDGMTGRLAVSNDFQVTGQATIPVITNALVISNAFQVTGMSVIPVITNSLIVSNNFQVTGISTIPAITNNLTVSNDFRIANGIATIGAITNSLTVSNTVNVTQGNVNLNGNPAWFWTTAPGTSTAALPAQGSRFVAYDGTYMYFGATNINNGPLTNWVRVSYSNF